MEIKGRVNAALCFAKVIEAEIIPDRLGIEAMEACHTNHNYN